jgi:hypothetical protein
LTYIGGKLEGEMMSIHGYRMTFGCDDYAAIDFSIPAKQRHFVKKIIGYLSKIVPEGTLGKSPGWRSPGLGSRLSAAIRTSAALVVGMTALQPADAEPASIVMMPKIHRASPVERSTWVIKSEPLYCLQILSAIAPTQNCQTLKGRR